jgi:Asp-tRNA(Asn)/Glu-tRNA(Gln) amidotransferase A subunit family amidase
MADHRHGLLLRARREWPYGHAASQRTRALRDFRPKQNAAVLELLLTEGAIVMGKTNLHELSYGWTSNNETFGSVHNPHDRSRIPGGSSGGSAAAVAARIAPLAIGEDTFGSIRVPATCCGLAGLRPTFSRYPDQGIMALTDNKFDQVGPLGTRGRRSHLVRSRATKRRRPRRRYAVSELACRKIISSAASTRRSNALSPKRSASSVRPAPR